MEDILFTHFMSNITTRYCHKNVELLLTVSINFLCNGTNDLISFSLNLLTNCGLFPKTLHGASNNILSKLSSENGGPFRKSPTPPVCFSCTILVESAWKMSTFVAPKMSHLFFKMSIFLRVLSIAIKVPYKIKVLITIN